jgi:adenosine deaminase
MRTHTLEENLDFLDEIAHYAGSELSAVDFAGLEDENPDPLSQIAFFEKAKKLGFGITLHCCELPNSLPNLRNAVEKIKPQRIAHGSGVYEDINLCTELQKNDIMLDLCPTSNIQAGLYSDYSSYPVVQLMEHGVPISINSDSNVLGDLRLSDEYINLLGTGCVNIITLWKLNLNALRHAFLPQNEINCLINDFESWAKEIPELSNV